MEQPFIYKYKPKVIEDFKLENKVSLLLNTLIDSSLLNILLVGNPGCGKSTLIECIIKTYYGENYDNSNILTINSLKDQGISYYRTEVKTFCQTICTIPNKKKIVILDDIDLINEHSQQVFRNCIDKNKNNIHFISSCTNIQKVIDSFQSRVVMIKIEPLQKSSLSTLINNICKLEKIIIDEKAKKYMIDICNLSVRNIINYLEKFKLLDKKIDYNTALDVCTNISLKNYDDFINYCKNNKLNLAINILYNIFDQGYSVIDILDNFYLYVKINEKLSEEEKYKIIKLISSYIVTFYNFHEDEIELSFLTNDLITLFANNQS